MNITLAQQNYHVGNFEANTKKIIAAIEQAKQQRADLIVFSELCVCGYTTNDLANFNSFIDQCYQSIEIIKEYADSIGVIVGSPAHNPAEKGKDLFNAAFFLYEKEVKAVIHKTLIPTYDVFDEYRYFEPADEWNIVEFKGKRLAITICEDIWNLGDNPMYRICPMDQLIAKNPDIMINLSASPFNYMRHEGREAVVHANVQKYQLPMLYCNTVGAHTELIFDGDSMVLDKNGTMCASLPMFEEALVTVTVDDNGNVTPQSLPTIGNRQLITGNQQQLNPTLNINRIHDALILGIRDYFSKQGFTKAILGSSGGLDSAVVLALACEALGNENVIAILMPSPYSTEHSISDAVTLSKNLNNPYHTVPIDAVFQSLQKTLEPLFKNMPVGVAEENMQSRIRGNLLMSIANKFNYILLNTSNKSELATGYGTLYGDMTGGLSIIGDCYKLQVYALAHYINRDKELIPAHIINKPPSAELRPGQKDSDTLPEYGILDKILYQYIEKSLSPKDIEAQGFDPALVNRVLKLVNNNEYKRNQFCPVLRVSPKAFGTGRKMPIVAKYG